MENAADVCDGVGLFHGALLADGVVASPVRSPRVSGMRCSAETGTGNGRTGSPRPSSASKHFRSSSSVDPITADELAALVRGATTGTGSDVTAAVVLDCRCFLAFNTNHVAGAFNAACADKFSRRRLTQGRATVADLVSGGPSTEEPGGAREVFRRAAKVAGGSPSGLFVAYDDDTTKLESLQESHPLRLLTASLTSTGYRTKYLQGKPLLREVFSLKFFLP